MNVLISEELVGVVEGGLSITVACRDAELRPDGAPAFAARVHDDRAHVTLYVPEKAAPPLIRKLEKHPEIAALFDRPTSHRAIQLKGRFVSSRRARVAERAEVVRQLAGFVRELEEIGIPPAMSAAWQPWPCVAVVFQVTDCFEQSPGPGAGERLE